MISETERKFLKTGFKEVLKIIEKRSAEKVFIAEDISPNMKERLETAAASAGTSILYIDSMKELGKLVGIDVGASSAVVLKH